MMARIVSSFLLMFILTVNYAQDVFIDPKLLTGREDSLRPIVIIMKDKADLSAAAFINNRNKKAAFIHEKLLITAEKSQKNLISFLSDQNIPYRRYFIVNMISMKADLPLIKEIAGRNDVWSIIENGAFYLDHQPMRENIIERSTEWGLKKIKAPEVWSMGYEGEGIVVGGQDTGYEWEHDQLKSKYRGWNGSAADHDYNWHDAIHENDSHNSGTNPCGYSLDYPCDDHNHGTHTMGTMLGHHESDTIGVAPKAKWIGCRNMERGWGTLTTYIECFEWFLAPYPYGQSFAEGDPSKAPHVIANSWGCPPSEGCNSTNFHILEEALNNLRNAGCVVVVSNGNYGPNCATTTSPAAFYEGSFSVGATNSSDLIASFSSRGPVTYDSSNRLKPEVVAPGVGIRSSIKNNSYATYGGTSMAGPHVAGAVALVLSANPDLIAKPDLIETILEQTAMPLTGGSTCGGIPSTAIPNNTYGYGLIDAEAAVNRAKNEFHVPIIKVDQFGYKTDAHKIAILSDPQSGYNDNDSYSPSGSIALKNSVTHAVVYSAAPVEWNNGSVHSQSGDKVWWFDFSSFTTPGKYYVADGAIRSEDFLISENIYHEVMETAFKTYYYQRCGIAKSSPYAMPGYIDELCHPQDNQCRYINAPDKTDLWKDMSGGWHDAGDYNKYVNFAYGAVIDLLLSYEFNPETWISDDMNIPESGNGIPDFLDEIKYELDWLIKMQDTDGGVNALVGVQNYATASPPSSDTAIRYYGPKTTSASFSAAAMMAFAAIKFRKINSTTALSYADALEANAISAYNWGVNNPVIVYYNEGILAAGEQEVSEYERKMRRLCAAVYLYALTENSTYRSWVEANYTESNFMQWSYVYPFENPTQLSLLYYAHLPGITASIGDDIKNTYKNSIEDHPDNFPSHTNQSDAYRAYLKDDNYVWGSNQWKTNMGNLYQAYLHYELDPANEDEMKKLTADYLHYIHGRNPTGLAYMSNMAQTGASNSVNSIYHGWFNDGSELWDDVRKSVYGPAPGFIPGGPNPEYNLDQCCETLSCGSFNDLCIELEPPQNQPIQKSYRDWNTGWPQNSWEITENAIYYQASFLFLLSSKVNSTLEMNLDNQRVQIGSGDLFLSPYPYSIVLRSDNGSYYKIKVENDGGIITQSVNPPFQNHVSIKEADLQIVDAEKGTIIRSMDNTNFLLNVKNNGDLQTEIISSLPTQTTEQFNGDIILELPGSGLILADQDGICYCITVSDNGIIFTKAVPCE